MRVGKKAIATQAAPAAIGPYAQAVRAGDFVFCSGQIGLDPESGTLVAGGAVAECRRVMENLRAVLTAAGLDFADVVKTTIYLTDLGAFAGVNEVYGSYFSEPYPARATVGVATLPRGASVEIEAIALARRRGPLA